MKKILNRLAVPSGQEDQYLTNTILDLIGKCMDLCNPRASYTVFGNPQFNGSSGLMSLADATFHLNKTVASALCKSSEIVLFVCTCGSEVETYSRNLIKEGNPLEALITDLIGSEIAEEVAGIVHNEIKMDMETFGLKITNRYSPGYCNWPVSDQQLLFALMGNNKCNIQLSDSSLMVPLKSVSGIIGAGVNVENKEYNCALCDIENCLYRDVL